MPDTFREAFGFDPQIKACAPGRVNLLGEHTDYNDGFVLPTAIHQKTCVELSCSRDERNHIYAARLDECVVYSAQDEAPSGFISYVSGCIELLRRGGYSIAPVAMFISSDVPMGTGLSSSAALEVAVLRGMRQLFNLDIDDVEIAKMAQQAEIQFALVNCGIMDQMASSLADTGHMLFIDTRTLERKLLALPPNADLIVIDSGIPRSLATSMYNKRRAECEEAAHLLKLKALRDTIDEHLADALPEPLNRRARHVISENNRVLKAANGVTAKVFGELMNASHASLRDDYEVSIAELDLLVDLLQKNPDVYGARLTGAGFGGACVALGKKGRGKAISEAVVRLFNDSGQRGSVLV